MNLPDYNLDPPDYDNERSSHIVELLRDEFDEDYLCEADINTELMLKFVKGKMSDDELKELQAKLTSDYESTFSAFLDKNYDKKVEDLNDPY